MAGFNIVANNGNTTAENGNAVVFSFSLTSAPTTGRFVTIDLSSSDTSEGVVNKPSLTFTSSNWNVVQTFTVTGVQDYLNDGNIAYVINAKVNPSSTDVNYRQLTINPISLINAEDITTDTDAQPDDRIPVGTVRDTPVKIYGDAIIDTNTIETATGLYKTVGMLPINDVLVGLDNNDTLYGGNLQDDLSGGLGNDLLYGGYDEDFLYGQNGNDTLFGEQGSDHLEGGAGNDLLNGGASDVASDTLIGGAGSDTYYIYSDGGNDVINDQGLASDIDTVIVPYNISSYTLPTNIENGTIDTGTQASSLNGNTSNNVLTGNDGTNTLNGGVGNDTINSGIGNDLIIGGAGNDSINGGTGTDTASYSGISTSVNVNLGISTAQNTGSSTGTDVLVSIENVAGGNAADTLTGNTGNNSLDGGLGNDSLNGGAGNDTLNGGSGTDTANYSNVTANVAVNLNITTAQNTGGAGSDVITNIENVVGGNGSDTLTGNSASNTESGGAGNDTINGSTGTDTLSGGAGTDTFVLDNTSKDTISDFTPVDDTIRLENGVFTSLTVTGILNTADFKTGTSPADTNDYIIYNSTTGALIYDADGSGAGAGVQIAVLGAGLPLTNADFVVI